MNQLNALTRNQRMARRQRNGAAVAVAAAAALEPLEPRTLFSVGITHIVMDNRGQAIVTFNQNIRPSSVSKAFTSDSSLPRGGSPLEAPGAG